MVDENGALLIQFHSDKTTTSYIQDNSTLIKEGENYKGYLEDEDLSEEEKLKIKAHNERRRLIRRMGVDPDNEWKVEYEIIPEKEKVIKELKKAAKNVDHIYLATDLDREGEAIAWHLKEALGSKKYKYSRLSKTRIGNIGKFQNQNKTIKIIKKNNFL